jgi:uncharacterized DUF497 family protein
VVEIEFDEAKNARNICERDLSFERARDFDFATALVKQYVRNGELRVQAIGYLDDRLHLLCYKDIETRKRIISFRKANEREAKGNGFTLRR